MNNKFIATLFLGLALVSPFLEAKADDPCLPFSMPPSKTLLTAKKKVFAHYYNMFPLSRDNKSPERDYYDTRWLSPENDPYWLAQGGFLRTRPLPVPASFSSRNYKVENLKREIRLAIARGVTGFTYETWEVGLVGKDGDLTNMLKAASAVDPDFKIVLMADFSNIADIMTVVKAVYHHPNMYTLQNRLVVAPYKSEQITPSEWVKLKKALANEGYSIYLILTFSSLDPARAAAYAEAADGYGMWATPVVRQGDREKQQQANASAFGKKYMAGIGPQGYRPKTFNFWEAEGSLAYRNGWMGAIQNHPEWIQLTTWNDYSETSQVAPYTDKKRSSGTGYYNLTGYYSTWYLTGQKPTITHDVLYYFYRRHPVEANAQKAEKKTRNELPWHSAADKIELLAFLVEPAVLSIVINGREHKKEVSEGIQSFNIPLQPGTPTFSLYRKNELLISMKGDIEIFGINGLPSGYPDLTYWGGSASADGFCSLTIE